MKIINTSKYYKKIEWIGKGAYSKVYKIKRIKDNKKFALKKVEINMINEKEKENAFNEVKILSLLKNENIVGFIESFIDKIDKNLCIIMEFGRGGDLYETIKYLKINKKKLPEKTIKNYFYQILNGWKFLSKNKIIHRDLKSANVFWFNNMKNIKIGDFNVAKKTNFEFAQTQTGTPYYASPEVWREETYSTKVDIWSLGCIIYELCMHKPPFNGKNMNNLYKSIQKGKIESWDKNYSSELFNLILECFNLDSNLRPSAEELIKNVYFKEFNEIKIDKEKNLSTTRNVFKKKKIIKNNFLKSYKSKNNNLKLDFKKPLKSVINNNILKNKINKKPNLLQKNWNQEIYKNKIKLIINKIQNNFSKSSMKNKNLFSNSINSLKKKINIKKKKFRYNSPDYCIYKKKVNNSFKKLWSYNNSIKTIINKNNKHLKVNYSSILKNNKKYKKFN